MFYEIINDSDGAKVPVTSVTSVTNQYINKLYMLQAVTSCNNLLQNGLFWWFVTPLLQVLTYLLHLKCYKSACNIVTVVTPIYYLKKSKIFSRQNKSPRI